MTTSTFATLLFFLLPFLGETQVVFSDTTKDLYLGIDNSISLTTLNIYNTRTIIKSDYGIISKVKDDKYNWKICSCDKKYVYLKVYNNETLTDSIGFRLIPLPDPKIRICNQDGEIMFKGCSGIRADIENFIVEGIHCKIDKFKISIFKKTGDTIRIENLGSTYGTEALKAFDALKLGEKISLSDFIVEIGCNNQPRQLTIVLSSTYSGKKYEFRH